MRTSTLPQTTPGELSRRRRLLVLAICCASVIAVVMDISIVNVALPTIRRDLHAPVSGLQWTVDAYTLVLASFLVLAGSTADRVGRRRVFQVGLATFGLGSLLCGLAPSIGWLIAARALQAVGGTMLNPVAMAIVATAFPDPAERARAIGVFGSMTGLSLALGPILGGALVDGLGWHAIFWINLPIVAAAIVCTSLASAGRQAGTTLGVAIAGTIVGSALGRGGMAFTGAAQGVWWMVLGLGVGILALGLLSTGPWALDTAGRAAALFEEVDRGPDPRTAALTRR